LILYVRLIGVGDQRVGVALRRRRWLDDAVAQRADALDLKLDQIPGCEPAVELETAAASDGALP